MPHLVRRQAIAAAIGLAWPALAAQTLAAPASVAIRATGAPLSQPMVQAIADAAPSFQLSKSDYPEAGRFTPRQVTQTYCGTPSTAYLDLLTARNGLTTADLDKPLGERAYDISLPNCLYVRVYKQALEYSARAGDTYSTIRQMYTGVQGTISSNAHFFSLSASTIASGRLAVGERLSIPYATSARVLAAAPAAAVISAVTAQAGPKTPKFIQQLSPQAGLIVSFVHGGVASSPETPAECGATTVHPFVAEDVRDAFAFGLRRARSDVENLNAPFPVEVMVVDNGFYGAAPGPDGLKFRDPEFRRGFFDTSTFGSNLGPAIEIGPKYIYPLNDQDGVAASGALSGHGTHVTGLVLGGPDFVGRPRDDVFGAAGPAWLQVAELNVGLGSDQLLTGSEQQISSKLALLATSRIVNMSISYDGAGSDVSTSFGFMNQADRLSAGFAPHLYVVAAGNNDRDNAANYYPAALGGSDQSTSIVTVAALGPSGALTQFTNVGPKAADVAAPGCNIASWIDATSPPVPLSGTSQAAPIVSFQAALLRGLTNASAGDLKARITVSGDLLQTGDQSLVSAHVKINIVTSLYVFDDYVKYNDGPPGSPATEVLGTVLRVDNLKCTDGQGQIPMSAFVSYKSDGANSYGYREDGKRVTVCPLGPPQPGDTLVIRPAYTVAPGYPNSPDNTPVSIAIDKVQDVVMRLVNTH